MSKIYIIKNGLTDYIEGDLNSITNGTNMFNNCTNITTFTSDLSSLTNGSSMFYYCKLITTFTSDLSSLTNGSRMFYSCEQLTTFTSDLSSLVDGSSMFSYCSKFTTFTSDLSSLTNGSNMFGSSTYNCTKLNLQSVQNIATTINDLAAQGKTGSINIGMTNTIQGNTELEAALATIRSKGWTVSEIYKS